MKTTELTIVQAPLDASPGISTVIQLRAERATLAKRRWRGLANDGREFGFDLAEPLTHGSCFFANEHARYVIEQTPEPVLLIALRAPAEAARLAWQIGNLHLAVHVMGDALQVADEPAARRLLERERLAFQQRTALFLPLSSGGAQAHPPHAHG